MSKSIVQSRIAKKSGNPYKCLDVPVSEGRTLFLGHHECRGLHSAFMAHTPAGIAKALRIFARDGSVTLRGTSHVTVEKYKSHAMLTFKVPGSDHPFSRGQKVISALSAYVDSVGPDAFAAAVAEVSGSRDVKPAKPAPAPKAESVSVPPRKADNPMLSALHDRMAALRAEMADVQAQIDHMTAKPAPAPTPRPKADPSPETRTIKRVDYVASEGQWMRVMPETLGRDGILRRAHLVTVPNTPQYARTLEILGPCPSPATLPLTPTAPQTRTAQPRRKAARTVRPTRPMGARRGW